MKSCALPTPSHRHPSERWGPATFAPAAKALDPSFRWDDGHNATPSKEFHA